MIRYYIKNGKVQIIATGMEKLQLATSVSVHLHSFEFSIHLLDPKSFSHSQEHGVFVTDMSDTLWPGPLKWAPTAFSRLGPVLPSVPVTLTRCWYILVLNSDTVFQQYCERHLGLVQVVQ